MHSADAPGTPATRIDALGWPATQLRGRDAVVVAKGVTKAVGRGRGRRAILGGVDLVVQAGELVAITGRSGSGKSTLLHVLGGLDAPDGGSVRLAGREVAGASERELSELRRASVGFVFQFFHLVPELSGEANVMLAARLPGGDPGSPARAQRLIDELGLRDVAGSLPHELSGGEQQRFAIARALVADPPVILADEPTGNLDEVAGSVVVELLRGAADDGRAVVVVTHEPETVAVADRVLRLEGGRLRA